MKLARKYLFPFFVSTLALLAALASWELVLRFDNSSMKNYDIEMWRYAKLLKQKSDNPRIGYEHVPSTSAVLQSVSILTNEWGFRGPAVRQTPPPRRILVLGNSLTLGWGVSEELTWVRRVQKMFSEKGQDVEILNAGIGNSNVSRNVELFLTKLKELNPTDVLVQFFPRDGEIIPSGNDGYLIKNSQLAAMMSLYWPRLWRKSESLESHYRSVFSDDSEAFKETKSALELLASFAKNRKIRLYLVMTPEMRQLSNYPLAFIHEKMHTLSKTFGYKYIDLIDQFRDLPESRIWNMPKDPHPNAYGHEIIAGTLFPYLSL